MPASDALESRIADLEARLRAVEDVEAIRALKARYGELVDSRYTGDGVKPADEVDEIARRVAELFTEDAVWDGGKQLGVCKGRDAIAERMRTPTLRFTWHYFVKPQIRVEGDQASARWDILAPCSDGEGRPMWMSGVEDDEYRRVDGQWLHTRMQLSLIFMAPHDGGWKRARPPF